MSVDPQQLQAQLQDYTGTGTWWRHFLNKACTFTDGVKHFAEQAGAFWFVDIVMTEPVILQAMQREGFVIVWLDVSDAAAVIRVRRDTNDPDIFNRRVPFTDCPEGQWKFYFCGNVLMVPSEY